jgi:hypothetical protein
MANIALTTAERIEIVESIEQATLPAGEAITAGAPVRPNASGQFVNGNGTTSTEAAIYGIATRTVASGEAVTAVAKGVLSGFDFTSQAYGAPIYVSDTDARLGDAAGTVSVVAGEVIPAWGQPLGTAADKLLRVDM